MKQWVFDGEDLLSVCEALDIAEDKTGNFYKFSFGQWKRHRYDIKTLPVLKHGEIITHAFALLNKCSPVISGMETGSEKRDFYFICLQDHQILKALNRDKNLRLLPLLVYILTHELVHIVRFCNFLQRFEVSGEARHEEERVVHSTTFEILKDITLPRLDYILESYQSHRICDLASV
jgi:hypothetical protein